MDSLRVLCDFNPDRLDQDWIGSVWDAEFVAYDEPADEHLEYIENENTRLLLHESCLKLKAWIAANCEDRETTRFSWQDLMILNVNVRGLLAMLGYIIKSGQRANTSEASRQACLEAASLYLMFLTVPGSNAFRVYHPNLYLRTIETLRMSEYLFFSGRRNSSKEADAANSSSDDESSDHYALSRTEKLRLARGLNRIISDLIAMLKVFRFKEQADSLDTTIRMLLDVTRLEMYIKFNNNNGGMDHELTLLSKNAFAALRELCSSNHGTVALTVMLIAQYMLPYLLYHHANAQPKSVMGVHEASIYFLKSMLQLHEQETRDGIVTLMHQLMIMCPERSEGRQKQAAVIIRLLNISDKGIITTAFQDMVCFAANSKISYRLFAQEIIGKLLTDCSPLLNNSLDKDTSVRMRKILVAVVLCRCTDRSPLVRSRAMATLALFSDCNNDVDKTIVGGIFDAAAPDKTLPALDSLKRALLKDADPLPGSNTLIAMLLDRVNDERALIRRNALRILRNLSVMFPSLMNRMTRVISDRCRDPTLTVRQFAVHVLSEILERFPHHAGLLDEWTQAVVPQIYDVESKVQEKVLECLEGVLINRITNAAAYTPSAASTLPWRVLDKLSSARMRKHLSKACSLWVKNGVITKHVISNLQSHIGTDNATGAWILLAALAESMMIPSISEYVADYKEVIRKNDFHASLVLHVLRHTWSALNRDYLEDLHRHLYACLCKFEINFNLISVCLDILNGVLRYLYADKSDDLIESNMSELMRVSETEIQDVLNANEDCAQEDASKLRVIFTLGHSSLLCTGKISSSTLLTLERLLLQWDSLPEAVRSVKNLQASTVVLLCQQALRDREIAKKVTPILGNLMRQETSSDTLMRTAVKINAAKALADICVRFTALVEPYLPDMCVSMKDSNPAVREAIVVIFIQLLLEDFIKVKGPFFFHILTMLSDADSMIRELTIFLVEERLLVKNKTLISQQFLESIYHYNNYWCRDSFRGHRMHEQEKKLLTLPGRANQDKRNVIYEFMLEHLDPPAKLKLVTKLTNYILREICETKSTINVTTEEGECVLKDTLFVISNNRLQPSSLVERHKDDTPELDETVNSSNAANNNATNIIIAGLKKHNLDNLLPTLVALKKKLTSLKSPLKDDAERILFKIYSEYEKEHLLSLLNEYPELEKDMDHYQRRLKDKTSDSDDGRGSSPSSINYKSSLPGGHKLMEPVIMLHRLSPSEVVSKKNDLSNDSQVASHGTLILNSSIRIEKLSPAESSREPSFSTSTPFLHINSDSENSHVRISRSKRSSSDRGISPDGSRCKTSRSSVSR